MIIRQRILKCDHKLRDSIIFGYFGASCNVTDGEHTYFCYPENMTADGLFEYTLMPTRMTSRFSIEELVGATLSDPFSFTKGLQLLKVSPRVSDNGKPIDVQGMSFEDTESQLFNVLKDPKQEIPLKDEAIVNYLLKEMHKNLKQADAPEEIYSRFNMKI